MIKNLGFSAVVSFILIFFITGTALGAVFDPNLIISDEEMLDSSTMSLQDISDFLKSKGGFISTYTTKDANGNYKTAAEIIYNAANNYDCDGTGISAAASTVQKEAACKKVTINPKLLLVLLQKEMSLIEEIAPTERQLDWACGYGCPDGQACNPRWLGFGKQVNSAALQFFDYMENPQNYAYKSGLTYTISNTGRPPSIVTPLNQATAALYNYTPHVYNGNYNFYKLWLRYFTRNYPNGTLLQAKGEPGVWLIQDGKKRPFLTKGALTSRFDINKVVQVNKSDLDKYITGAPLLFPQYSLVRSPRGTVFLIVDDKRRGFTSSEALRQIGYNPEEIIDAGWDDINAYTEGQPLTASSSYPTGALLQDKSTGGVYYVTEGTKAPLWSAVLLKTKYKWKSITQETPEKLASYTTVEPAIFGDGELLTPDNSPAVYVIEDMKKRPIVSGKIFEDLGYKWGNIISVPAKIMNLYEEGAPISEVYSDESLEADNGPATSTPSETGTPATEAQATTTSGLLAEEVEAILNP